MKTLLLLSAAAAVAFSAAPAVAQHHDSHHARVRHAARHARWNTGYRFGPRYSYTTYTALPRVYVTRYHLSPRYRYVYTGGYIYQVDPTTYAVTRIIDALTGR